MQYFEENKGYEPGNIKEEVHMNKVFKLEQGVSVSVIDYDEYLGSVEASDYEACNYYDVTDYQPLSTDIETLDLTWMKKDDYVNIRNNGFTKEIKKVLINMDNINFCHIYGMQSADVYLINNNCKMKFNKQIKALNDFIDNNKSIYSIKLHGFNPILTKLFELIIKKNNIEYVTENEIEKAIK